MIAPSTVAHLILLPGILQMVQESKPVTLISPDRWAGVILKSSTKYPTLAGLASIQGDVILCLLMEPGRDSYGVKAISGPPQLIPTAAALAREIKIELKPTDGPGPWAIFITAQFNLATKTITFIATPTASIPKSALRPIPPK